VSRFKSPETEEAAKKNLKMFQPGKSGNPVGRKPGTGYKQRALQAFQGLMAGKDGEEFLRSYLNNFKTNAKKPDTWQARFLAERLFKENVLDEIDEMLTRGEMRETAFLSYRLHKRAHDVQRQILFSMAKHGYLMAGRRSGKTEAFLLWFADKFIRKPNARCLYVGLTITKAMGLMWQPMIDLFGELGIKIKEHSRVDGRIVTDGGGLMQFGGNSSKDDREKNRGPYWDGIAIDEAQSQKELLYLIESILSQTLIDTNGQLLVGGTGPRTRGTYWEALYLGQWSDGKPLYPNAMRLNWNISQNPFIPDYENVLANIRAEKNLSETDPLYQREYLGRIAYDDDALVLRLGDANAFTDDELSAWVASQSVADIRFTAGMDFGFEDADALGIIAYSITRPERFLVYEWKARRQSTEEIAQATRAGIDYINTSPLFARVENKSLLIYADTGGNKITPNDLAVTYKLPILPAYKAEKEMGFELLQGEARTGHFKVRRDGPLWEECLRTVYARDEQDRLTRMIDDDTYHPDMIPAVTYGMRPVWMFGRQGGQG
jgi:hypothetical protein